MLYLSEFSFPDNAMEFDFFLQQKRTCHDSYYPFQVLSKHGLTHLSFEPVTILYGGNGSGKTTAINVIAETLKLDRDTRFNRSAFFDDYTALCTPELRQPIPENSRIITSDDVFDYMLNLRALNEGIDLRRHTDPAQGVPQGYTPLKYYQVFERRNGFLPDISIADLLFNMGPESILILNESCSR